MLIILTLAGLALLVNVISYVRSPDFRLRRWTRKWGIQHYVAFAHAEAAGVRIFPVDRPEMGKLRQLAVIKAVAWPTVLVAVAVALLTRGTPWWGGSLVLWALLLPQLSPHLVIGQVIRGQQSGKAGAAVRGSSYVVIGWVLLFAGVAAIWWAAKMFESGFTMWQWGIQLFSGVALLAGAGLATRTAKRILATVVPARFGRDATYDDTLFLRSFNDDAMRFRAPNPTVGILGVFDGLTVRFEELLAFLVTSESPLVAIGKPGEPLPELGAVRTYVSDDEWQSAVEETAKRVDSIMLIAGVTNGLEWELTHLREWGLAQKATVLLPPVEESQAWNRLHRVLSQLGINFDEVQQEKETGAWLGVLLRTVTAIGVDEEGQPCFYVSDRRDWISFGATILMSEQIVRGEMLPPEHGSIAESVGFDVRDSVLTQVASQTMDPMALDHMSEAARRVVTQAIELANRNNVGVKAEHVLVALLAADHEATAALETMGVDVRALRSSADELVNYQSG
ncbi:Clp protease N-terminal domain-containing protein [Rhodococcus ruber]|uniref:Clp protease N-terminal domain-containing protein n=1 Tax=Rhodococcus ruber TaxID=1830 RepID=UPI003D81B282